MLYSVRLAVTLVLLCVTGLAQSSTASAAWEWGVEQSVSVTGAVTERPALAFSGDGSTAVVAWDRAGRVEVAVGSVQGGTATWSAPTGISDPNGYAYGAVVAISSDGSTVVASWLRNDGLHFRVQAVTGTITGGVASWGIPVDLSDGGRNAEVPSVALSANGTRAIVAWRRFAGAYWVPQASRVTITGGVPNWSAPTTFSSANRSSYQPQAAVARNGSGGGVAWHFDSWPGIVQGAFVTTSAFTSFTPDTTASTGVDFAFFPRLAIESGVAMMTWTEETGGGNHVIKSASALLASNPLSWSAPSVVSGTGQPADSAVTDLSADGSVALATWHRGSGANVIAEAAVATVVNGAATWQVPSVLSAPGQSASYMDADLAGNGEAAIAVWQRADASSKVRVQFSRATMTGGAAQWSTPVDISVSGKDSKEPVVGLSDDASVAIAVWLTQETPGTWVVKSRVLVDRPSAPADSSVRPIVSLWRVTMDPAGGECTDETTIHDSTWTSIFMGYRYLPGEDDCERNGFTFTGWAEVTNPVEALRLPLLTDPTDGKKRWFVAANHSLVATWTPVESELENLAGKAPGVFVGGPDRRTAEGGGVVDGYYIPPGTRFG